MLAGKSMINLTIPIEALKTLSRYGSAYMLTMGAFMLLIGRVYTFYSPKRVFLAIIVIFEIGSVICGAAPTSNAFIIGRAISGLGAAGMMNGAIVIMVNVIPLAKRPVYQGIFGSVFGIASVAGPLLGGAFTQNVIDQAMLLPLEYEADTSLGLLALVFLYQSSNWSSDFSYCCVCSQATRAEDEEIPKRAD